jgi:ABC-type multidrug transport system, ATPase and permease components
MNKLFRYLRPIWWLIVIDVILLGLQSFFALLIPKLMTNITAIMEYPQNYLSQMNGLIDLWNVHWITPSGNAMQDTWIIGGFMMTFALGFLLCAFATSLITSHIGAFYGKGVRHDLFKKVTSMSVGEYHDFGTASLITRTTNDIEQTQLSIQMGLRIMIMSPVSLVIAIIFICTSDPMLGLIVACVIPVLILVAVVLLVKATPLFKKLQDFMDKLTSVLRESLKGVRVIRAFNQEDKEFGRFEKANKDLIDVGVRVDRIMSFGSPIIGICFDATYIAIYVYGFARYDGAKVADGAINFTTIITSAEYAMQLVQSFLMFMFLLILVPRATACAKRINEVFDSVNPIIEPAHPKNSESNEGLVEFKDVTFSFPKASAPTLSSVSFTARPGCTTAIIGSTGSGKSTAISLIPRFYDVSAGQVLIDGVDVRSYDKRVLRGKLGFVPQTAQLFRGSLRDNIAFGKEGASDDEIKEALKIAQANEFTDALTGGLDFEVEQDGKNFSGGQKQRLAIARALVRKPEIYIFDDSFSALDFKTDVQLRKALKSYTQTSTIIIVAQRVSTIIDADQIIVFDQGKIVGQGNHTALLKSCPVYQEIVESQLDKEEIAKTLALASQGGER